MALLHLGRGMSPLKRVDTLQPLMETLLFQSATTFDLNAGGGTWSDPANALDADADEATVSVDPLGSPPRSQCLGVYDLDFTGSSFIDSSPLQQIVIKANCGGSVSKGTQLADQYVSMISYDGFELGAIGDSLVSAVQWSVSVTERSYTLNKTALNNMGLTTVSDLYTVIGFAIAPSAAGFVSTTARISYIRAEITALV